MSIQYKNRINTQLKKLMSMMYTPTYIMDLMHTYMNTPENKFAMVQKHVYETNAFASALDMDTRFPHPDAISYDPHRRMLHAMAKKFIDIIHTIEPCAFKLLERTKKIKGMHRLNFPVYIVGFYYVSMIDSLTHDYEGVLVIIKHFLRGTCEAYHEDSLTVVMNIMEALDYNIRC